jgi:hypothetical protein
MIVKYKESGWDVITQRSHGLLASQLAFHWRVKERPARWVETLLAIAEHDDTEIELDGEKLITPAGGPLDYSMKNFEKARCERLAMFTVAKSRYIALLVSLHMEFLHKDEANINREAADFLKQQKKIQKSFQKELGLTNKAVKAAYCLLEWCDAFSLLICQEKIPPENRAAEISTGPDGKPYTMFQLDDKVLVVDPWPFETQAFDVRFEYRPIDQLAFKDSSEFRKAFRAAPVEERQWTIRKKPPRYQKPAKL